jgi:hypothetical protein
MTTHSNQEVFAQAIVGAMSVSIMATAMGIMMGAVGASAYKVAPSELKGTQAMVRELKLTFGGPLVDQAVKDVGTDSALTLADRIEQLVIDDMYKHYGQVATDAALKAAMPGDIASAREIAASLAARGYGKGTTAYTPPDTVVSAVTEVATKRTKMRAKPQLDTKTNITYKSESAAAKAVAAEYGLDPENSYVWFQIVKVDPGRFRPV